MEENCVNGNALYKLTSRKKKHLSDWTCEEVASWLKEQGFDSYVSLFSCEHKIDGKALLLMTEEDLRQPPLSIKILGDLKHIFLAISSLQKYYFQSSVNHRQWVLDVNRKENHYKAPLIQNVYEVSNLAPDNDTIDRAMLNVSEARNLKPEIFKTLISLIYFFCVSLITSCVMVIVHDRVPDMDKYPPLPDIFLDNVPLIPWAFQISEVAAFVLVLIMINILVFHRHRFIILRRFFALTGTVFLLRCVTMLITSLSVPGTHLKCVAQPNKETWSKVLTAFQIWRGAGLSIQGVRTCGDYMYSGHTSMLTMLNFFITEYTPRKVYFLHTFTWILNMFGIFFILAAHEHYSIDVFIAFYITSRLFMYYHTLANNRSLMCDAKRTKIWFPMLAYFECNVNGMVPNEFEWPFTWQNLKSIVMLECSFTWKNSIRSKDATSKKKRRRRSPKN